ncbi:MAG: hypothetical protein SGPRY_011268, partial [Prymnesium sp.]
MNAAVPDTNGVAPLPGESEGEYIARQQRLKEEAAARMRAKFGTSGGLNGRLGGVSSGHTGGSSSSWGIWGSVVGSVTELAKESAGGLKQLASDVGGVAVSVGGAATGLGVQLAKESVEGLTALAQDTAGVAAVRSSSSPREHMGVAPLASTRHDPARALSALPSRSSQDFFAQVDSHVPPPQQGSFASGASALHSSSHATQPKHSAGRDLATDEAKAGDGWDDADGWSDDGWGEGDWLSEESTRAPHLKKPRSTNLSCSPAAASSANAPAHNAAAPSNSHSAAAPSPGAPVSQLPLLTRDTRDTAFLPADQAVSDFSTKELAGNMGMLAGDAVRLGRAVGNMVVDDIVGGADKVTGDKASVVLSTASKATKDLATGAIEVGSAAAHGMAGDAREGAEKFMGSIKDNVIILDTVRQSTVSSLKERWVGAEEEEDAAELEPVRMNDIPPLR